LFDQVAWDIKNVQAFLMNCWKYGAYTSHIISATMRFTWIKITVIHEICDLRNKQIMFNY
jgi:hypothetical protein